MHLTFSVNINGMRRRFHALVESTLPDALDGPLLRTGGHLRARIKREVFDTEGAGQWPALDPETLKRKLNADAVALLANPINRGSVIGRIAKAADISEKAGWRGVALAAKIADYRARGKKTGALDRSLAVAAANARKSGDLNRMIQGRAERAGFGTGHELVAFARREVARAKRHGALQREFKARKKAGEEFSIEEQRAFLRKGKRRYAASEQSTKMLGGLRNSLSLKLLVNRIEIFSKAHIGAIHNFGGVAGHGAKIKARKFMDIAESDLDFLVERLEEQMIRAWHEAD